MSPASERRGPKRRRRRRRRRGGRWRWLGLGVLGLAGAALLRRPSAPRSAPAPPAAGGRDDLDLPADVSLSWIPGPAGSLRIGERHRQGRQPLVFVHGLAGNLEQWAPLLASIGPGLRAVAFDLPGHGGSDPAGDGDYSPAALSAALGAVIAGLGLRRPIVVAHSLGALAAIDYAGRYPERLGGLFLVDPGGDQSRLPEADRANLLEGLRRDPRGETEWGFRQLLAGARPEVADRVLRSLASTPDEVLLADAEGATTASPLPALERYGGPVRSLASDCNRLPQSLHRLRPELPTRHLAEGSHWLMMDRPDEVWEELVDFLEEVISR